MSKIEVNQISSQCGSTLTIGQSGDTVTLACGASQTGFGRTGTVNWDTTAKTAGFTAVSGNGYFVNTTSGAITVTLPASPSPGDIVSIADYTNTFATNNVTVGRNSEPIGGIANDSVLSTDGLSVTFVYVDGTEGWKNINDATSNTTGNVFIAATGGTITTCGDYKIHTFTGPGTFTVTNAGLPANSNVDYLVVAGGGAGGNSNGGGGGAGGYRESSGVASGCYSVSPLGACVSALPVTATGYPITVGGGGTAGPNTCATPSVIVPGSNSVFSTITSAGGAGGGGGFGPGPHNTGANGGSGGGGGTNGGSGGTGNTPPVSPPQGTNGGAASPGIPHLGGGGGGATEAGFAYNAPSCAGQGGDGATSSINATPTARAGGGGGGSGPGGSDKSGGSGGGGTGKFQATGVAGTTNTGGGGGGGGYSNPPAVYYAGGNGGSGVVIIRYKYQ